MTAKIDNPCFEAALDYIEHGWSPIALRPSTLTSYRTKEHTDEPWGTSKDPEVYKKLKRGRIEFQLGIATGARSGFWVLDLDGEKGLAWWDGMKKKHPELAEVEKWTVTARSPSGGLHLYFAMPAELEEVKSCASEIAEKVDVKGDRGMIYVPPTYREKSEKKCAGFYEWINHPLIFEIAETPEPLVAELRKIAKPGKKKGGRATNTEKERREDVALLKAMGDKGKGHESVRDLTARWAAKGVPQWATEAAVQANAHTFDKNAQDLIDSAYEKFAPTNFEALSDDDPDAFLKLLDKGKNGIYANAANAMRLVRHMPGVAGLRGVNVLNGMAIRATDGAPWTDRDTGLVIETIQSFQTGTPPQTVLAGFSPDTIRLALKMAAIEVNPVRDMLDGLPQWDGVKRIDTLLIDAFGAEDTPLTRTYSRKWPVGMIARGYAETNGVGVQMDTTLCLVGRQGLRKSAFCKWLATERLFSDQVPDVRDDKRAAEAILGRLVVELSEGDLVGKLRAEELKSFLTRQVDKFRPAYAENVAEFVRTCAFMMPVNHAAILRDETGSRRFWAVEVHKRFEPGEFDREQILAEAKAAYLAGEQWWLTDEEEEARIEEEHKFEAANEMIDIIKPVLARVVEGRIVTVQDVLDAVYGPGVRHYNDPFGRDVKAAFAKLGWQWKRTSERNGYVRTEASLPPVGEGAREGGSLSSAFKEVE